MTDRILYQREYRKKNREHINKYQRDRRKKIKQQKLEQEGIKNNEVISMKEHLYKKQVNSSTCNNGRKNMKEHENIANHDRTATNRRKKNLKKIQKTCEITFHVLLLCSFTYFLVFEQTKFYNTADHVKIDSISPLFQAVIAELTLIALSIYKASGFFSKFAKTTLMSLMVLYTTYSVNAAGLKKSEETITKKSSLEETIRSLKKQISEKKDSMNYFQKKDWPGRVRELEKQKSNLETKLYELQSNKKLEVDTNIERANSIGLSIYRLVVQLTNLLLAHRLSFLLKLF